jgi:peptide/nickel transport system permease protein
LWFLTRRILTYIIVFLVTINLDFLFPRLLPGNAAISLITGGLTSQREIALLTVRFGLNQPILTQYYLYLKSIFLSFPPFFGVSFEYYPTTVSSLIIQRIPFTALLLAMSLLLGGLVSYTMTVLGVLRRKGKYEIGALWSAVVFLSTPVFWIALILLWIFAIQYRLFPAYGIANPNSSGIGYVLSVLWHSVLPVVTMTAGIFAHWYLVIRSSTQQVLKSDYVTAARNRGLKERVVATKYIMRNSLLPIVSVAAFSVAALISLSILIEAVFGYAGVGDLFADAIFERDYPVLEGGFFWVMIIIIAAGLIGDFLLTRLDPRIRGEE